MYCCSLSTITNLDAYKTFHLLDNKKLYDAANREIKQMNTKCVSSEELITALSGGNQQKVVFSKWIKTDPKILYLHEPTRGVDVQSKLEIYSLVRSLAEKGVSVVLFTSDMLELIGLSDEIYVMYEGRISGHLKGEDATEEKLMRFSAGVNELDKEAVEC